MLTGRTDQKESGLTGGAFDSDRSADAVALRTPIDGGGDWLHWGGPQIPEYWRTEFVRVCKEPYKSRNVSDGSGMMGLDGWYQNYLETSENKGV